MELRPAGPGDVRGMQQLASRLWPSGWHPGGLGWGLSWQTVAESVVVAVDGDGSIVGFAGRGGDEITHVAQDRDDVADALVAWLLDVDPAAPITVWDGADALARAVVRAGLAPVGREPWSGMVLDVAPARVREDPRRRVEGYVIRPVGAGETAARVEVHRAAWKPSSIPYTDGRVIDPAAESSFTEEAYAAVRGAWRYDRSLDLVAVTGDGGFAACCIAWLDPATGVCEIEPLGVAPEHRRRGLAVALCLEVAALVADRGATQVFLNTQPQPGYVASSAAYAAAGFELIERATTYAAAG